jgi:hypothetical protein
MRYTLKGFMTLVCHGTPAYEHCTTRGSTINDVTVIGHVYEGLYDGLKCVALKWVVKRGLILTFFCLF